ncbi:MAG: hypothetical protein ACRDAM_15505, partial [Casimicrobium sp.]
MLDRDTILREIGLTPIWRSRDARENDEPIGAPIVTSEQISQPVVATSVAPTETQEDRALRIASLDWNDLIADIAQCTACKLCKTRT